MRTLLAASLFALSSAAWGTCDMELTINVQYTLPPSNEATNVRGYYGMDDPSAAKMNQATSAALDKAKKTGSKNMGGHYNMTFLQSGSCPLGSTSPVTIDGLTLKGVTEIWKGLNQDDSNIATGLSASGGNGRAFGKKP
jgi:hypothetical protein